jgi:hypothetical protein
MAFLRQCLLEVRMRSRDGDLEPRIAVNRRVSATPLSRDGVGEDIRSVAPDEAWGISVPDRRRLDTTTQ